MSMIDNGPPRRFHRTGGRQMTKQSDALETDVNQIVNRYTRTGQLPLTGARPQYGDFTGIGDYHTALSRIQEASDQFMQLPSAVREYAANDPGNLLELLNDPEQREELFKLGLDPDRVPPAKDAEPAPRPDPEPEPAPPPE